MTGEPFGGPNSPRPGTARRIGGSAGGPGGGSGSGSGSGSGGGGAAGPMREKLEHGLSALRAWLLVLLAMPLFVSAIGSIFSGDALGGVMDLAAFLLILGGAFLTREGLRAEQAWKRRLIARAPALPRKILGGVAVGLGVLVAVAFGWEAGWLNAILLGGLAAGAHITAFGLDPMRAKGGAGAQISQAEALRVSEALEKAEGLVAEITERARAMGDREITEKVARMTGAVQEMLRLVEEDPRDLTRARRFLGVYLRGARDATVKFAENRDRLGDPKIRDEYVALIDDMADSFARGREQLLVDDRMDLEVEIEVLRERLQKEGI